MRAKFLLAAICSLTTIGVSSSAQTRARPSTASGTPTLQSMSALKESTAFAQNANAADLIANEIAQLRKSLESLNARLLEISQELIAPDSKQTENDRVRKIATNFDLLTHAEERAEILRKQLIELIEKETAYKARLTQLDEDMRPENIERAMSGIGSTRTPELRDNRRRVLENERRGVESLLSITTQSRNRLEEDVRQADLLVTKLRQRLFPMIEREIEKLNPN